MTLISVRVDLDELAGAIAKAKGGNKRAYDIAMIAAISGIPAVSDAMAAVITATDKAENAQHSRGERAALDELFRTTKLLRMAVRTARAFEKEQKQ